MKHQPSPSILQRILQFQRDELTSSILYEYIAGRQKDEGNRTALLEIAKAERSHYTTWKGYTGQELRPNMLKIFFYKIIHMLLGDTFTIKLFEIGETFGAQELREIEGEIPEARTIMKEEEEHEDRLMEMVDEERLHYIGSMVLGLNDALVELTGTIAGLTFALMNTRLVALSGIITGVSATLSMAASNYLAERADGNAKALKSSFYTGMAYLVTVALMVLPYLLLPNSLYLAAFAILLAVVVMIIAVFNYYVSVVQSIPFWPRFAEMGTISLSVAAISFVIGLLAKHLLGIEI
ncbi:MAG TPA: VIT1/CCC1 transporter family protein [Synergistales bacterium]|nr:VIT1/CCC1 transporter family protein [Synergistales bacterium]HPE66071.1 VIT1/CCC1 transporter family protein [Synergistales bacterium]